MERTKLDVQPILYCQACKQPIKDFFLLHLHPGVNFHVNCLKCFECGDLLNKTGVCFVKDGRTYCRVDHDRLFRIKCGLCNVIFSKDEMVMRPNTSSVYHIQCFRCIKCNKVISTGDMYLYHQKQIYCCVEHQMTAMEPSVTSKVDSSVDQNNNDTSNNNAHIQQRLTSNDDSHIQQQLSGRQQQPQQQFIAQPQENQNQQMLVQMEKQQINGEHLQQLPEPHQQFTRSSPSTSPTESIGKPIRYRTPMTEAQLSVLKNFYQTNPRPDGSTRDNLAQMIGLNARVVRVWFQNKRCKDKRDMDKGV